MQSKPSYDDHGVEQLSSYRFVRYIRRKKTKVITNTILAGCFVFIPQDISLPIFLKRKDICESAGNESWILHHIATAINDYQFRTLSKRMISILGTEIRTIEGFPEMRLLSYSKCYRLRYADACTLFGIKTAVETVSDSYELLVFVINAPFERGVLNPSSDELLTYSQLEVHTLYLSYYDALQPHLMRLYNELNTIIVAPIERPSQNSLYFLNDVKGLNRPGFRESLISAGKQYLQKVQKTVNEICSLKPELRSRKQSFLYAIHHWSLHTVTGRLMPLLLSCCQTEINRFIDARRKLASLTLEDLHVPKAFLCNVSHFFLW